MPFFLDDEVPRRSLVACGPVVLRLGRYVIAGIPFDAEMPASVAAADPANGVPAPANEPAFAPASNGSAEPAPPSAQASSLVGGTSASARRSVSDRPPPTFDASGRGRRARLHQRAERSSKQEGPHSDPRSPAIRAAIKPPAAMARTRMALAPLPQTIRTSGSAPLPRSLRSGRSTHVTLLPPAGRSGGKRRCEGRVLDPAAAQSSSPVTAGGARLTVDRGGRGVDRHRSSGARHRPHHRPRRQMPRRRDSRGIERVGFSGPPADLARGDRIHASISAR